MLIDYVVIRYIDTDLDIISIKVPALVITLLCTGILLQMYLKCIVYCFEIIWKLCQQQIAVNSLLIKLLSVILPLLHTLLNFILL